MHTNEGDSILGNGVEHYYDKNEQKHTRKSKTNLIVTGSDHIKDERDNSQCVITDRNVGPTKMTHHIHQNDEVAQHVTMQHDDVTTELVANEITHHIHQNDVTAQNVTMQHDVVNTELVANNMTHHTQQDGEWQKDVSQHNIIHKKTMTHDNTQNAVKEETLPQIVYDNSDCALLNETLDSFEVKHEPTYIKTDRPFVIFDISESRVWGQKRHQLRKLLRESKGSFADSTDRLGLYVTFLVG